MAQTREIKRRIKSVKNTQQITRAMKMVAAAKLRRAQDAMLAMRPYANLLNRTLQYIAVDLVGDEHPLFFPRPEVKRICTVVIAGDRGLCGGFNTTIVRTAKQHVASLPDAEHIFFAIGKRAIGSLRKTKHTIAKSYFDVFEDLSYLLSGDICDALIDRFFAKDEAQRIDEAYVVYNEFVNTIKQEPVVKKLLPVNYGEIVQERKTEFETNAENGVRPIYEIEPDVEAVMNRLISRRLATQVYRATLESYAAELAARMTAMDNATNNAEDMIDRLTLEYNRARQAGITSELLDIVGGANALGA